MITGVFGASSLAGSMTISRLRMPTCGAASPMPGASYMVNEHVVHETAQLGVNALDRLGRLAQDRIGKLEDGKDGHLSR